MTRHVNPNHVIPTEQASELTQKVIKLLADMLEADHFLTTSLLTHHATAAPGYDVFERVVGAKLSVISFEDGGHPGFGTLGLINAILRKANVDTVGVAMKPDASEIAEFVAVRVPFDEASTKLLPAIKG